MRSPVPASGSVAIFVVALLGACGRPALPPPAREPPARILAVGLEQISLRAHAYVELHAWLAAAGRGAPKPPPGLDGAVQAYRAAISDDDDDELLARTTSALAACSDDRCATRALAGTPFARAFGGSLDTFAAQWWTARATNVRAAIEIVRAAWSPEAEGLTRRLADDLAIDWPGQAVPVEIVVAAPPPGREALVPVVLAVQNPCFARADGERVQQARIVDCVLVRAVRALRTRSRLAVALERELGPALGARAWSAAAIHAVAAAVTSWEPKHVSVTRRSAMAAEPELLRWLAENWRDHASPTFAARYAGVVRTSR